MSIRPTPKNVRAWLLDGKGFPNGIHPEDAPYWIDALDNKTLASALRKHPLGAPSKSMTDAQRDALDEAHKRHQSAAEFRPRHKLDKETGYVMSSATWDSAAYLAGYATAQCRPELTEEVITGMMGAVYARRERVEQSSFHQPIETFINTPEAKRRLANDK